MKLMHPFKSKLIRLDQKPKGGCQLGSNTNRDINLLGRGHKKSGNDDKNMINYPACRVKATAFIVFEIFCLKDGNMNNRINRQAENNIHARGINIS